MSKPITSGPYRTFRALNPDESYVEFEGSTITIPMKGRRSPKEPWMEESIKLRAHMRLEVYPPYLNQLGTREFQFTIRDWDLYGKSPMLNRLFFDDPRGKLVVDEKTGLASYAPAVITFCVSHHYHLHIDGGDAAVARDFFGPDSDIEMRNLTSHHTRVWAATDETDPRHIPYSNPSNKVYWQIIAPDARAKAQMSYLSDNMKAIRLREFRETDPIIVFHSKPADLPGDPSTFDIANPQDRARYLLAVGSLFPEANIGRNRKSGLFLRAGLPVNGLNANLVQLPGNTIVSPIYRSRQGLDIRVPLSQQIQSASDFEERTMDLLKKAPGAKLTGHIQIVSPPRCLCTADQAPESSFDADAADFPARFTYAANYDIYINNHRFVEDQAGIAVAVGAEQTPPVDVKVAFEKPQAGVIASRYLEFSAGTCTGMMEISTTEYYEGLNFARYWRTVPLDSSELQLRSANGEFDDYDPTFEY